MRSRRSDQPRRTHDGRACQAVFLVRRVSGGWPNEGAVVWLLGRPACTAPTGSPGLVVKTLMQRHTEFERDPICHIEPVQLIMMDMQPSSFL